MKAGRIGSRDLDARPVDVGPRVKLTVRLYAGAHELLIAEFEHIGRRRRAARAAQLMTLGLLCERTNLRPSLGSAEIALQVSPLAVDGMDFGLIPEADTFVSEILHSHRGD